MEWLRRHLRFANRVRLSQASAGAARRSSLTPATYLKLVPGEGGDNMERRFTDRVPTEVGVACRVPASPERALLVDLSRSGCRLEFGRHNIDAGATVNLDFRTGKPVGGEVVWTDGAYAGVRFNSSLPKPIAVEFGLEPADPQPQQCDNGQVESARHAESGGLLRHWVRRLTGVFA